MGKVAQKRKPLEAALSYAKRGWAVVPLLPGEKSPWLDDWPNKASTNPKVIKGWYRDRPKSGVGIVTGAVSGIFVLDVDVKDGQIGDETLANLEAQHGELPITIESITGTKGRHIFFKHPGYPISSGTGKLGQGLDIKADKAGGETGHQVVAPPSRHPVTKQQYEWELSRHPDDVPLADAPSWLLGLIKEKPEPEQLELNGRTSHKWAHPRTPPLDYIIVVLDDHCTELARCAPGNRNDTLNEKAYILGRFIPCGVIKEDIIVDRLRLAVEQNGLLAEEPEKTNKTLESALAKGKLKPWAFDARFVNDCAYGGQEGTGWLWEYYHWDKYAFDRGEKKWYRFEGHSWKLDRRGNSLKSFNRIKATYGRAYLRALANDDKDKKKLFGGLLNRLVDKAYRERVLDFAGAGKSPTSTIPEDWDINSNLIGCTNGVLDLSKRDKVIFRAGQPADRIKKATPVTWPGRYGEYSLHDLVNMGHRAKRWQQFIDEIFSNDGEVSTFVQKILGYGLARETDHHIFPIFWGAGRNGKSTLIGVLEHVLGPLAVSIETSLLMSKKNIDSAHHHTEGLMPLKGAKISYCSETSKAGWLDNRTVKKLTGGDRLRGRPIYGESVEWDASHIIILLCNDKPKVPVHDEGLWQRLMLVPFLRAFVDTPTEDHHSLREPGLLEKLKDEGNYILPWLLAGLLRYRRKGLKKPAVVVKAEDDYKVENNNLALFIKEACELDYKFSEQHGNLWKRYKEWCNYEKLYSLPAKDFRRYMEKRFGVDHQDNRKYYLGISGPEKGAYSDD